MISNTLVSKYAHRHEIRFCTRIKETRTRYRATVCVKCESIKASQLSVRLFAFFDKLRLLRSNRRRLHTLLGGRCFCVYLHSACHLRTIGNRLDRRARQKAQLGAPALRREREAHSEREELALWPHNVKSERNSLCARLAGARALEQFAFTSSLPEFALRF